MEQLLTINSVICVLALVYLITLCANWDRAKRSYNVCVFLFVINAALVVVNVINDDAFLSILWIACLAINGSELGRRR
jgi:hypothetical protein